MAEKIIVFQKKTYRTAIFVMSALATVLFGSGFVTGGAKMSAYQLSQVDFIDLIAKRASADVPHKTGDCSSGWGVGGTEAYESWQRNCVDSSDIYIREGDGDDASEVGDHDTPGSGNSNDNDIY